MILHENIDKNKVLRLNLVFVLVILLLGNLPAFNSQLDKNHKTHSIIRVASINTELKLFLNGAAKNDGDFIQAESDDLINVTVYYRDNITKEHIPNATVTLLNWNKLNETNNYYNITIDVKDLELGITFFTISAQKENYQPQTIHFFIEVTEIASKLQLFLNGEAKNDGDSIQAKIDDLINVTVYYRDNITKVHIPNATVELLGWGILNEINNQYYNITINAADLDQGVNFLTIYAQKDYYEPQTILFVIQIIQIETELSLFIDGEDVTLDPSITRHPGEILNITVSYDRSSPFGHIPGAIVEMNESGILELLNEAFNNYSVLINTNDLNQGPNFLTIFAQKDDYEPQTILLIIEIIQIETELTLSINSNPLSNGDTIQVEADDLLNITVYYRDMETKQHLPGAIVDLEGRGQLEETNSYYNITLYTSDLDQGITIFSIFAQLTNYESQSIQFFVKVVEKATNLQLFLNGEDNTLDPTFNLTIGQILNITVKYTDNETGNYINTAVIQIIGEGFTYNLTRDDILEQYYIILNTEDLGIGVKLFSIVAHANNFQIKTIDLRITVSRMSADIRTLSGVAQIEAEIGDNVLLQIILNDTIFGGNIIGALVTYTWAYGQGELEDSDNDGIYEVLLENVREGVHTITIIAFAGDNYDFEPYELTLIVITPSPFMLTSDATIPDTDGSFILMWNSSIGADNYSVYQYDKYITEINGSIISLENDITDLILPLSNYGTGTYYFIVVAHNEEGDTLSNCIEIIVALPPPGQFMLWSNAGNPDIDGEFNLLWSNSSGAVYYSVYQYDKYITDINRSLTLLTEETTDLGIFLNNYLSGTYYFIVVAHGDYGDTLSNCIQVSVVRTKSNPQISGYNLFFLIVILSVILVLVFKNKIKQNFKHNKYSI